MAACATRTANKSTSQIGKLGLTLCNLGNSPAHKTPWWTASSFETVCLRSKSTTTPTFSERLASRTSSLVKKGTRDERKRSSYPFYLTTSSMFALVAGLIVTKDHEYVPTKCDFATKDNDETHPGQEVTKQKLRQNAEQDILRLEGDSARHPHQVSVGALQGVRWTMEDTCSVESGGRFVAVFDGHGGSIVSTMLRDHLYQIYRKKLVEIHGIDRSNYDAQETRTPSVSSHVQAIREALKTVEAKVIMREDLVYQGSTAVAVIMHVDKDRKRTILAANIGDSRAVLSRNRKAVPLTRDHKPSDVRERARIRAVGVDVEWDPYGQLFRVCDLSLSRAIGDRFAKPAVSSETEITSFPLLGKDDEFVVLASDGLWDVMSNQETIDFVHERLRDLSGNEAIHKDQRSKIAEQLANEGLKQGSADNVCVLIMWLTNPSTASALPNGSVGDT